MLQQNESHRTIEEAEMKEMIDGNWSGDLVGIMPRGLLKAMQQAQVSWSGC